MEVWVWYGMCLAHFSPGVADCTEVQTKCGMCDVGELQLIFAALWLQVRITHMKEWLPVLGTPRSASTLRDNPRSHIFVRECDLTPCA